MTTSTVETRDITALRRHYEVERELADRLRAAATAERKSLYRTVYEELFERVPDHPQNVWKIDTATQQRRIDQQMRLLRPFLDATKIFLEVGAGDCGLTKTVAGHSSHAYGVEIADSMARSGDTPNNFSLVVSDGTSIPVADDGVDVAYTRMLFEHLHPEDAAEHLREVNRVLAPGGVYVCETPHRYSGPQDISAYFDEVATGFHLKEYTYRELQAAFRAAGFDATRLRFWFKGRTYCLPRWVARGLEGVLGLLPVRLRRRLALNRLFRFVFSTIVIVGYKGRATAAAERQCETAEVGR